MFKKLFASLLGMISIPAAMAGAQEMSTSACSKFGHPEFVFSSGARPWIDGDANWFKTTLEGMVAGGERFKDGENMQVGPMLLKIKATKDKKLRLYEPDMKSMPFNYIDSVGNTLLIVRKQRDAVLSLPGKETPLFAPMDAPLLLTSDALTAKVIFMQRARRNDAETGWVLSNAESSASLGKGEIEAMSVYEAVLKRPEILNFLALPDKYSIVIVDRKTFMVFKDGVKQTPTPGSFLELLSQSKD